MIDSKWIRFVPVAPPAGFKTLIWDVVTVGCPPAFLGQVRWYSPWRKYAFLPGSGTLFEPTCLRDLAAFIEDQMAHRARYRSGAVHARKATA